MCQRLQQTSRCGSGVRGAVQDVLEKCAAVAAGDRDSGWSSRAGSNRWFSIFSPRSCTGLMFRDISWTLHRKLPGPDARMDCAPGSSSPVTRFRRQRQLGAQAAGVTSAKNLGYALGDRCDVETRMQTHPDLYLAVADRFRLSSQSAAHFRARLCFRIGTDDLPKRTCRDKHLSAASIQPDTGDRIYIDMYIWCSVDQPPPSPPPNG